MFKNLTDLLFNRDKIYILPTKFGAIFILVNLAVLMAAASYANNLVFFLTFVLFSLLIASLVQTHYNFKETRLVSINVDPGHAGGYFIVDVYLSNSSSESRRQIYVEPVIDQYPSRASGSVGEISGNSGASVKVKFQAKWRGRLTINKVRVWSVYPIGLWHVWTVFRQEASFYVYPQIKGDQPLPEPDVRGIEPGKQQASGGEDFSGHKDFAAGDSFRHIDWKAQARHQKLLVKQFEDGSPSLRILDWDRVQYLDQEMRLSQLTKWILESQEKSDPFGLLIPGQQVLPGIDRGHVKNCLEVLSVYGKAS